MQNECFAMRGLWLIFSGFFVLLSSFESLKAQRVLVLSDLHDNHTALEVLTQSSSSLDIDYIILLGDITRRPNLEELVSTLSRIRQSFELPASNIFFAPGNRDTHGSAMESEQWKQRIQEEAQLVTPHIDEYGYIEINSFRIAASHFPLRRVPEDALPHILNRTNYLRWLTGELSTSTSMAYAKKPDQAVDLILYGHTHIPALYRDPALSLPVFNPGALVGRQAHTYGILDISTQEISVHQVNESSRELIKISIPSVLFYGTCINALKRTMSRIPILN